MSKKQMLSIPTLPLSMPLDEISQDMLDHYDEKSRSIATKGGKGSGYFGHAGRPGEVGGSAPSHGINESALSEDDKQLLESTVSIVDLMKKTSNKPGVYYSSYDMVLENGRFFKPQPLPEGFERGEPKMCYENASILATRDVRLTYCEGFATSSIGLPVAHAWVVDAQGNVIDNTWDKPGRSYFGIPFTYDFLVKTLLTTKMYGMMPDSPRKGYNPYRDGFPEGAIKDMGLKGGKGSGHFGHAGRPGKVGGSLPGKADKLGDFVEHFYTSADLPVYNSLSKTEKAEFDLMLSAANRLMDEPNEVMDVIETPGNKPIIAMEISNHDPAHIGFTSHEIDEIKEISRRQKGNFIAIHNHPSTVGGTANANSLEGALLAANLSGQDIISQVAESCRTQICVSHYGMYMCRFNPSIDKSTLILAVPSDIDVSQAIGKKIEEMGLSWREFGYGFTHAQYRAFRKLVGTELMKKELTAKFPHNFGFIDIPKRDILAGRDSKDPSVIWYKKYIEPYFDMSGITL